jgi:hypothetical protein
LAGFSPAPVRPAVPEALVRREWVPHRAARAVGDPGLCLEFTFRPDAKSFITKDFFSRPAFKTASKSLI